jgi:hypothetical protein
MRVATLLCLNILISLNKPSDNYFLAFYLWLFYTYNPQQTFKHEYCPVCHHRGNRYRYCRTSEASPRNLLFKVRAELKGKRWLPEQMFWRILMKVETLPCLNILISLNKPSDNYILVFYLWLFNTYFPCQTLNLEYNHRRNRHCYLRSFNLCLEEMELMLFKVRAGLKGKKLLPDQMFWRTSMKAETLPCLNIQISLNKHC